MKKLISLVAALAMSLTIIAPALAEEVLLPPDWALEELVEAGALGLWDGVYGETMATPISNDRLSALTDAVAAKLALLELPLADESPTQTLLDGTRGAVSRALYAEAARYVVPHAGDDGEFFLAELGILRGDGTGEKHLDRACTELEAVLMAERLVLAIYDWADAGTRGLLWKATNGGNTLYLFGTAHLDRNNLYPLHRTVRDALAGADAAIFELDLNDQSGLDEVAMMQVYTDGTTLRDHVSAELYEQTMSVLIPAEGLDEETRAAYEAQLAVFKPWALALTIQNMMLVDESTGATILATDAYLTNMAYAGGTPVGGVETYALQIAVFDTLSEDYQAAMLADVLGLMLGEDAGETVSDAVDAFFLPWQQGDLAGFEAAFGKAAVLSAEDDELSVRLFADRDPGMIEAAAAYLEAEGRNVFSPPSARGTWSIPAAWSADCGHWATPWSMFGHPRHPSNNLISNGR